MRYLIVNADDFGQCRSINRGIIRAFETGIVTSASLMVRWPAAAEAAAYARANRRLSVGLHVDLGEWAYTDGTWKALYEVVPMERSAVISEVQRQLETFRRLLGCDPSHLDSHQHVHRDEPVRSVLRAMAQELKVPLRSDSPAVNYCGFYGQTAKGDSLPDCISAEALMEILRSMPAGVTELGCHPGFMPEVETMYRKERELEVDTFCDPRLSQFLREENITLCSFRDAPVLE